MNGRWAILRGGPKDGAREPILGVPAELIYGTAVYRHLHPHRTTGTRHEYEYLGERLEGASIERYEVEMLETGRRVVSLLIRENNARSGVRHRTVVNVARAAVVGRG